MLYTVLTLSFRSGSPIQHSYINIILLCLNLYFAHHLQQNIFVYSPIDIDAVFIQ